MKKSIVAVCVILCICLLCGAFAFAGPEQNTANIAGRLFKNARGADRGELQATDVVAEYGSHKITKETVDYYRNMQALGFSANAEDSQAADDKEIAEQLIRNIILEEEAVRLGLAATDAEVEEMLKAVRQSYELAEGKQFIDDYCAGAGITVEEYFDLVAEQLPETITRQKLKDEYGRIYCKENGIEFTKVNQPAEMKEYVERRIDELFEAHKSDVIYSQANKK